MKLDVQPRPKLSIPLTKLEIGLELLTVPLVVLNFVLPIVYWHDLPDVVPSHFDLQGTPNGFSPRSIVWVVALFALGTYVAMTVVARFPHTFNYVFPITEKNAPKQYVLARKFLSILKLEGILLLFFAGWNIIQVGTGAATTADVTDMFTLTAMLLISCLVYIFSSYFVK
ncbi:MAG TPA: DUF1648 domain-containing protein [Trichormus sp.]|jgi:uncharacterized membrane protein